MEYRRLGRTDISVSLLCLGTMTWGEQNTEAEAHAQLDAALDAGINFIDTAEMYPVPPSVEKHGRTESYLGSWLASRRNRDKVVLATKVSGRSRSRAPALRGTECRLDRSQIMAAVEASLRRLRTDYVDLYQTHWPDRAVNGFGRLGYVHDPADDPVALEETMAALGELVQAGKVRAIGLSNDTPWGVMRCLRLAETMGVPRIASIQNPYNLLNRSFEVGLAEITHREDVSLLAYSALGMATLAGKYLDGARPPGARLTLFDRFKRYLTPEGERAAAAYVALARRHGLDPAQMALAYVNTRPFVTATILGATSLEQLASDIGSLGVTLSQEVLDGIDAIHRSQPNPCP